MSWPAQILGPLQNGSLPISLSGFSQCNGNSKLPWRRGNSLLFFPPILLSYTLFSGKTYKSDRLNSRIFIGKPLLSVGSFYVQRFVSVEMCLSLDTMVYYLFLFIHLFFAFLRAALMAYGHSQTRGLIEATCAVLHHRHSNVGSGPHLWPTWTTAHSNTWSLTHWGRLGIALTSSWILVRFVSSLPQWELPMTYSWRKRREWNWGLPSWRLAKRLSRKLSTLVLSPPSHPLRLWVWGGMECRVQFGGGRSFLHLDLSVYVPAPFLRTSWHRG